MERELFGCESLSRASFVIMGDVDSSPVMRFCCDNPNGGAPYVNIEDDASLTIKKIIELRCRLLAQGNSGGGARFWV